MLSLMSRIKGRRGMRMRVGSRLGSSMGYVWTWWSYFRWGLRRWTRKKPCAWKEARWRGWRRILWKALRRPECTVPAVLMGTACPSCRMSPGGRCCD